MELKSALQTFVRAQSRSARTRPASNSLKLKLLNILKRRPVQAFTNSRLGLWEKTCAEHSCHPTGVSSRCDVGFPRAVPSSPVPGNPPCLRRILFFVYNAEPDKQIQYYHYMCLRWFGSIRSIFKTRKTKNQQKINPTFGIRKLIKQKTPKNITTPLEKQCTNTQTSKTHKIKFPNTCSGFF